MIATEPRPFAEPNPSANALKTGTLADLPRVPEDADAINARTLDWYPCHMPQHHFHCWMVEQISVTTVRIEHNGRVERRLRDRASLRAERFWDDDRRFEAIQLGDRLARDPESVVNQLKRTPQGCDWMIDRWARLARIADVEKKWDEAQRSLAFDLLGARPEDRTGPVGELIDSEGQLVASLNDMAALARREIATLQRRKEEVAGPDVLDRALAQSDYIDEPTPEIRRLRRRDSELHRRMKWYIDRIGVTYIHKHPNPRMDAYFKPLADEMRPAEPAEEPEKAPKVPAAEAVNPEPEPEPEPETDSVPFPAPVSTRNEAKTKKTEARREARLRKLDRRRA